MVQWPGGIQARGEVRNQFHHVIDVAPTVLEVARLPEPTILHGVTQEPMHGVSVAYSFDDANAADRHQTQHFEMMGNRGIYHKGWTAVTKHRTPWVIIGHGVAFDDDVWELYDIPIPAGDHQLRLEFAYDGGGLGKGGTASLFVDGEPAGTGRVDRTAGYLFHSTRPAASAPTPASRSATTTRQAPPTPSPAPSGSSASTWATTTTTS